MSNEENAFDYVRHLEEELLALQERSKKMAICDGHAGIESSLSGCPYCALAELQREYTHAQRTLAVAVQMLRVTRKRITIKVA